MRGNMVMKKMLLIGILTAAVFMYMNNLAVAADPPHSSANSVKCESCHSVHKAAGSSLTNNASNANLCLSCHTSGGSATLKKLSAAMQATPGASGTSHRWDVAMPSLDSPNNAYGLRPTANLTSAVLKAKLTAFSNVITCSVCHNQHGQANAPWDPNAPSYAGAGTGSGRHFQRITDDLNNMCEDCHYYRVVTTSVRTYTGNKLSHPVVKVFTNAQLETPTVTDSTQFNAAPLEPASANWAQQTGARYHLNGGTDTNVTNNMVVDANKQTRCMSCHGIHYTDSSSGTIDQP